MNDSKDIARFLSDLPLFNGLSINHLETLATTLHSKSYPQGSMIFHEGDPGDSFSIILEGYVDIIKSSGTIGETLLSALVPGDFMGEMSLLEPGVNRTASAYARTDVLLLEMTAADFERLLVRQPKFAVQLLRGQSARLRESEDDIVNDLRERNVQLTQALEELKAAQKQLVEKERLEFELNLARQIQENFLPKEFPVLPGWHIAGRWQPARMVGGDFYDFVNLPDGSLGITIGDVSGKGIPASLVMAITQHVLRAVAAQLHNPDEVLYMSNNLLSERMPPKMFVTCLYMTIDPRNGHICFANAGHNLPTHCRSGIASDLRATGMPLGLLPNMAYQPSEAELIPGDSLLLFSDGVVEVHNEQGEMFGFSGIKDMLSTIDQDVDSEAMIAMILDRLTNFAGPDWGQEDDVTLLAVQYKQSN